MGVALISVSDKTGIVEFAQALIRHGFSIISTGGTAKVLTAAGIPVRSVEEITGSPEMLGGRVKTLHPAIHGGILARTEDLDELKERGITPIDIVVCNLYPFERTIAKGTVTDTEAIEEIDIGGVTLLRAAAKNHARVTVVCDPKEYTAVAAELPALSPERRRALAARAFSHTAAYDAAISHYFTPEVRNLTLTGGIALRYGENPHQHATFYPDGTSGIGSSTQLHGKQLSYNNYLDGDAALAVALELGDACAAVVVKHTNPCGIATGNTPREALEVAWSGDIVSAFGSVIAFTKKVDLETAEFFSDKFIEIVLAPSYTADALTFLCEKSKNLRVLTYTQGDIARTVYRQVSGGMLAQDPNLGVFAEWTDVTTTAIPQEKRALAEFTMIACKHTKSNAVILGLEYAPGRFKVLGMGAGQPNRVDSLRKLALAKAHENLARDHDGDETLLRQCVLASDAFFPFDDTVREAAAAGIRFIVQPGGSIRDKEVIAACDELGVAMVFTKMRHFKH